MSSTRTPDPFVPRTGKVPLALGTICLIVAALVVPASPASAAATYVDLGTAASYSILGGTGVANTGTGTVLSGNLGLSPAGVIAGFPPGTVNGTIHDKDAAAATAQSDRAAAYANAATQVSDTTFAGDQAGQTFLPGVHKTVAAFTNTGIITLDGAGDQSSVFVFQIGAAFSSAASTKIVLTNGALANNVFWQVVGAVSLGAGAEMVGTFLGNGAITFGDGASIKGRALTPGTVAVTNSPFTEPVDDFDAPIVTIDGGATRSTNDTTPSISGTSDEPVGKAVTVTVGGQTLTTTVHAGGLWNVSSGPLTSGPHAVVASITDASQNVGTATQTLTVDTNSPAVTINGGASAASNDTTPVISGTSDEPLGTTVDVTVGVQSLTTTVGSTGTWAVQAGALTEAHHGVRASIVDAAGNTGTVFQVLTIDVTIPVVGINGGAARSTDDTSPWIYGTSAEQAGTTVNVSVGGQSLTATVATGGAWGVSAQAMTIGAHAVVASITDAAGNTGTANQDLTITTVTPPVEPEDPDVPKARYQPDEEIRAPQGGFVGSGIYAVSKQRVSKVLVGKAKSATFKVRIGNRGNATDRMIILGTGKNTKFKVKYAVGGVNVTSRVIAGTYVTKSLGAGSSVMLTVKITRKSKADSGDHRTFKVRAVSTKAPTRRDTVAAAVKLAK